MNYNHSLSNSLLPDFLIIGAQKSGTTFLYQAFRQHPETYLPARKELHYFDRRVADLEPYLQYFTNARPNQIKGEKTPAYFILTYRRLRILQKLLPRAKFILLLLRHPVHRAWSHAKMEVSGYNKERLSRQQDFRLLLHLANPRNEMRTQYARNLGRWLAYFPREQFHIAYYDELQQDPEAFFRGVCQYLGIPYEEVPALQDRVWKSPEYPPTPLMQWYLHRKYRYLPAALKAMGLEVPASWEEMEPAQFQIPRWKKVSVLALLGSYNLLYKLFYYPYLRVREYFQTRGFDRVYALLDEPLRHSGH